LHRRLAEAPVPLMWPRLVVFADPYIKIGLQLVNRTILFAERDAIKLIEHGLVGDCQESCVWGHSITAGGGLWRSRTKARALGCNRRQRVQKIAGRARQTVEARHHQRVAFGKLVESAAQLDAVGLRAAGGFPQDFLGSGGAQLLHLSINALCGSQNLFSTKYHSGEMKASPVAISTSTGAKFLSSHRTVLPQYRKCDAEPSSLSFLLCLPALV
jgi:hypothetical protein